MRRRRALGALLADADRVSISEKDGVQSFSASSPLRILLSVLVILSIGPIGKLGQESECGFAQHSGRL